MKPTNIPGSYFGTDSKKNDGKAIPHIAERIRYYRLAQNLSQPQLADMMHVTRNSISNWEAGRRRPDLEALPSLCKALGITYDEFFGEQAHLTQADLNLIERYHDLTDDHKAIASKMIDAMLEVQENRRREQIIAANRRIFWNEAKTAAGSGNPLESRVRGKYVYLHIDSDVEAADEIITVTGNSMEPTFHDGDALLVKHAHSVSPGEIGIFVANGEGFVKEYRSNGLYSHNPAYPLLQFSEDDNVRCIGRVLRALKPEEFASPEEMEVLENAERHT